MHGWLYIRKVNFPLFFCLKCVQGSHKCSWWRPCWSFFFLFRLFSCTWGNKPSLATALDDWRVAPVVAACIFVRVALMFGCWWLCRAMVSPTRRWRRFVGSRTGKKCSWSEWQGYAAWCVQYSSAMLYSPDVFSGFSEGAVEDFHDRGFSAVHSRHHTDVKSIFVEACGHVFCDEDVFAMVDFVLANLQSFVAASWFADSFWRRWSSSLVVELSCVWSMSFLPKVPVRTLVACRLLSLEGHCALCFECCEVLFWPTVVQFSNLSAEQMYSAGLLFSWTCLWRSLLVVWISWSHLKNNSNFQI